MTICEDRGIEPLLPELWISKIEALSRELSKEYLEPATLDRLIRLTYHLCMLAPVGRRHAGINSGQEECIELLLDRGQPVAAAMILLGESPRLELSHGDGRTQVRVRLFNSEVEGKGAAQSLVQALLSAIVDCLTMDHLLNQAITADQVPDDRPHKFLSGSRQ